MSIVAIDFETATSARDSACEIGLSIIEDHKIIESRSWLIRPPCWPNFDPFNIKIHGISAKMVANEPTFDELWYDLEPWFKHRTIVAHNASFDIGVLRDMLKSYRMSIPDNPYLCTYRLARKVWPDLGKYGLKTMIHHLSLELGRHHRAEYDSIACAGVLLHAMEKTSTSTIEELARAVDSPLRTVQQYGHDVSANKSKDIPIGNPKLHQANHPFYRKGIVISGTLESMSRALAWQKLADLGAIVQEHVEKSTRILVMGQNDMRHKNSGKPTEKQLVAERMIRQGHPVEMISETEFLKRLEKTEIPIT
jgi:DNA polymerase III subunit epsilon